MNWYKSIVFKGGQLGRTIGFPTLNLDPHVLGKPYKEGVYASLVEYAGQEYVGMLYLGPRLVLGETKQELEINVFDFDEEIYGQEIMFAIGEYIRSIANFTSFEEMKMQLEKDKKAVKSIINLPLAQ